MMRSKRRRAESLIKKLADLLGIPVQVTASERGRRLERYCASKCRKMGFQVIDHSSKGLPHDLLINGFRVQCKSRRRHGNNGDGVNLFKNSRKRYRRHDVDFFVIRFSRRVFVIPAIAISDTSGNVRGYISLKNKRHFVDAWHQLAGEPVEVQEQMTLFTSGV